MKRQTVFLILILSLSQTINGQLKKGESVYRRSSMYTLMINEPNRPYADVILQTFLKTDIPDKFNDHILESRLIDNGIQGRIKDKEERRSLQSENIDNFLTKNNIAKAMVAKWFNRSESGTFNMKLISERGSFSATELDVQIARSTKRGMAVLADAGEELISNTFLVVNDFDYVNKEEVADKLKQGLSLLNKVADKVGDNLISNPNRVNATLTFAGKGYVVRTTSYLFQLVWNDSVEAVFYNDYWMDDKSFDIKRKNAFENSDIFNLKLIGTEEAWAQLQSTSYTKKSEEELIAVATVRAIDAVIAKLQKKYEVFRTKSPLYSVDPLAAKIGLKEGIEKGDKYEVLEQVMDDEGRTRYKRKGIIRVDNEEIWDNRFMVEEELKESGEQSQHPDYTIFSGAKNYYQGMLIRQIN